MTERPRDRATRGDTRLLLSPALRVGLCLGASVVLSACDSSGGDGGGARESGFNPVGSAEPFSGTVFPEPDLLTADSPSDFATLLDDGRGARSVLDGRTDAFVDIAAFLFTASYAGGGSLEVAVNPELGDAAAARTEAQRAARAFGRLPRALRQNVDALWIHGGDALWGSDRRALVIHTGRTASYEAAGILEETLLHEAVHVSLDPAHRNAAGWLAAQAADARFVSTYAKDNPDSEDLAETFIVWLAARHLRDRVDPETVRLVEESIPARLDYLDRQGFDLGPTVP